MYQEEYKRWMEAEELREMTMRSKNVLRLH